MIFESQPKTLGAKPTPPNTPPRKIHDILSDPEKLLLLSDTELKTLLAPFIPLARKAVLPEEKPAKVGIAMRTMKEFLSNPEILAQMDAARAARKD